MPDCTSTYPTMRTRGGPPLTCTRGDHTGQHQAIEHVPARYGDPEATYDFQRQDHPAYDSLTTWGEGGASSEQLLPADRLHERCMTCKQYAAGRLPYGEAHAPEDHRWEECTHCGITFHNLGHSRRSQHPDTRQGWCFRCAEWMSRAIRYAEPGTSMVRPHGDAFAQGTPTLYSWSKVTGAFGGLHLTVRWDDGRVEGPRDSLWHAGTIPQEWLDYFPPNGHLDRGEKVPRAGHTNSVGQPLTYTGHPH